MECKWQKGSIGRLALLLQVNSVLKSEMRGTKMRVKNFRAGKQTEQQVAVAASN
jgi:hypothetical protein